MWLNQILLLLVLAAATEQSLLCFFSRSVSCTNRQPGSSYKVSCKPDAFALAMYTFEELRLNRGKMLTAMCVKTGETENCTDSGSLNNLGKSFDFKCPAGKVITEVEYLYDPKQEDGNFKFQCCFIQSVSPKACSSWSEGTRHFQYLQVVNSILPRASKPVITGISSTFVTRNEPVVGNYKTRVYVIEMCKVY